MSKVMSQKWEKDSAANAAGVTTTGGLKKVVGAWIKYSVGTQMLKTLRGHGLLAEDKKKVRIPDPEVIPRPLPHERVCFVDFVNGGFSFPVHDFLHAMMHIYRVQLHDFTPNDILRISCFLFYANTSWALPPLGFVPVDLHHQALVQCQRTWRIWCANASRHRVLQGQVHRVCPGMVAKVVLHKR